MHISWTKHNPAEQPFLDKIFKHTISFGERHIAMADSTSLKWSPLISVLSIYGIVNNHWGRGTNNEILSLIACY